MEADRKKRQTLFLTHPVVVANFRFQKTSIHETVGATQIQEKEIQKNKQLQKQGKR
jgi:hypothetical protein